MVSFEELVKTVEHLSEDELVELRAVILRKEEQKLFQAVEEARKESAEGKTVVLSSSEEIETFFKKMMNDEG